MKSVCRRPKHPRKGPREHPKRAKDGPRTLPKPSSAARSEQTRPKRVPRRIWRPSLVDLDAPKSSQEPRKNPPRAPKRRPGEPQNAFKTIFGSKMIIFQKSSSRRSEIKVFEGRKVSLGAQNRPQEAPRGDKKRHRKKNMEKKQKKSSGGTHKVQQRSF